MLLQRLSTRASSAWRPLAECAVASRISPASIPQRRGLHQVPTLTYDQHFAENGIKNFINADGYNIAWTKYQSLMVQRLNEITVGFEAEHTPVKQLVLQYARNPATASLFNYASMAHNNHFFFEALSPAPKTLENYSALEASLIQAFGSIETLKETMLLTADTMFGPGFVWLVAVTGAGEREPSTWRILTTYLAGTPYAEASYRQQSTDMNVANTAGVFGASSQAARDAAKIPPGGALVVPVLCVNTWEHAYMRDFDVDGKRKYLQAWWNVINWGEVDVRTPQSIKDRKLGSTFQR